MTGSRMTNAEAQAVRDEHRRVCQCGTSLCGTEERAVAVVERILAARQTDTDREEFCETLGLELLGSMEIMGIEDADMSDGRMLADTVYCLGYRATRQPDADTLERLARRVLETHGAHVECGNMGCRQRGLSGMHCLNDDCGAHEDCAAFALAQAVLGAPSAAQIDTDRGAGGADQ